MTDIALLWDDAALLFDLAMAGPDLATDDGLDTAIAISLFTDALANDDDALPAPGDRRGWWGDALPIEPGDVIGSRLWLLAREKVTDSTLRRAKDYAGEALAWLVADGIAASIDVTVEARSRDDLPADVLAIGVEVARPSGPARLRYDYLWSATAAQFWRQAA